MGVGGSSNGGSSCFKGTHLLESLDHADLVARVILHVIELLVRGRGWEAVRHLQKVQEVQERGRGG